MPHAHYTKKKVLKRPFLLGVYKLLSIFPKIRSHEMPSNKKKWDEQQKKIVKRETNETKEQKGERERTTMWACETVRGEWLVFWDSGIYMMMIFAVFLDTRRRKLIEKTQNTDRFLDDDKDEGPRRKKLRSSSYFWMMWFQLCLSESSLNFKCRFLLPTSLLWLLYEGGYRATDVNHPNKNKKKGQTFSFQIVIKNYSLIHT